MSASAIIHPHPDYPNGGYAIVEIVGAAQPGETISLTILDLFQERYLNANGWEATAENFGPYPIRSTAPDRFRFAVGPEIVNQLEEFKSLRLDFADQQTFVTWPGSILRDPSAKPDGTIFAEEKPDATLSETVVTPPPALPVEDVGTPPPPPQPVAPPVVPAAAAEVPLTEPPKEDSIDAILQSGPPADTSGLLPGEEEEVGRDPILEVPPSRAAASPMAPAPMPRDETIGQANTSTPVIKPQKTKDSSGLIPVLVLVAMILAAVAGGWWLIESERDQTTIVDDDTAEPSDGGDPVQATDNSGDGTPEDTDGPTTDVDTDETQVTDTDTDPTDVTETTDETQTIDDTTTQVVEAPDSRDCSVEAALGLEGDMLLILSDFADAADAGDCDTAIDADFALRLIEEAAGAGDPSAMLAFGALYDANVDQPLLETRLGLSLTDDPTLALGWYGRAREAGSTEAANAVQSLCEATAAITDNFQLQFVREDYCE